MNPVLIMAGGTGGHIFPGLAVAHALRQRGCTIAWLGSPDGMESRIVPDQNIEFHSVPVRRIRGQRGLAKLLGPIALAHAIFKALAIMIRLRPRAVLSMGGFAAAPGGVAAWMTRRPLVVHEQNSVAGWTNRSLARLASRILTGFPDVLGPTAQYVGNPVRAEICHAPSNGPDAESPLRVLVLGGSLGAASLNQTVPMALATIGHAVEVRHQSGDKHADATRKAYESAGVSAKVEPFIKDMSAAYGWANLVICRAGALTIAELCMAGRGAILVPFPHAVDDHQTTNARFMVNGGAARLIADHDLASELADVAADLLGDRRRLIAMGDAALKLAKADATERVADAVLEVAR